MGNGSGRESRLCQKPAYSPDGEILDVRGIQVQGIRSNRNDPPDIRRIHARMLTPPAVSACPSISTLAGCLDRMQDIADSIGKLPRAIGIRDPKQENPPVPDQASDIAQEGRRTLQMFKDVHTNEGIEFPQPGPQALRIILFRASIWKRIPRSGILNGFVMEIDPQNIARKVTNGNRSIACSAPQIQHIGNPQRSNREVLGKLTNHPIELL